MHDPAKTAAVSPPSQVGPGVDDACARLAEAVVTSERQQSAQYEWQRHRVSREAARPIPQPLVRIGMNCIAHIGVARATIRSIRRDNFFDTKCGPCRALQLTHEIAVVYIIPTRPLVVLMQGVDVN